MGPLPLEWDCASCAALEAEIERLNGIEVTGRKMWHEALASIEAMRAEIERLTAWVAELEQRPTDDEIKEAVRAALEPKP